MLIYPRASLDRCLLLQTKIFSILSLSTILYTVSREALMHDIIPPGFQYHVVYYRSLY